MMRNLATLIPHILAVVTYAIGLFYASQHFEFESPTLLWLGASDTALLRLANLGLACAVAVAAGTGGRGRGRGEAREGGSGGREGRRARAGPRGGEG